MTGLSKRKPKTNELTIRVGKRIQARREQLGWSTTKVSVLAGLSQSFVSKLERGDAGFSPDTLFKVAGALGISVDRILSSEGNIEAAQSDFRLIPVLDYVQAGKWTEVNVSVTDTEFQDTVSINFDCPGSTVATRVRGNSMEPEFHEDDILIVDRTKQPRPGSFVIATNAAGNGVFKRYREVGINSDGRQVIELVPLNPHYPSMRSDMEEFAIIGVVVEHRRKLRS